MKVVELPNLSEGGDVSDWLDAGGTAEELERLAREAPEWEPTLEAEPKLVGRLLVDVEPERISWLWPGWIPFGKLTLIDGDPGTGKSALTTDLAARVSTGMALPNGTPCEAGGVVLLNAEDGVADTIRPRLDAAEGKPDKVLDLATVGEGGDQRLLSVPADLDIIERGIKQLDAKLVIIDPLMAFLGSDVNSHRDQDVRRALTPLAKLAERTGVAVVGVRHLNKATGQNPLYRGGGSIGIVGQGRSALLVARHPDDERRRVLTHLKTNLSASSRSLTFGLIEAANGAVRVEWKDETSLDARALLDTHVDTDQRRELIVLLEAITSLLDESGGTWVGTATELHSLLGEKNLAALPDRPGELTKLLKQIAGTGDTFTVSQGWRSKERILRLRQRHNPNPLDDVGGVGSVGEPTDATNSTDATNAVTDLDNGVGKAAEGSVTTTNPDESVGDEGRERQDVIRDEAEVFDLVRSWFGIEKSGERTFAAEQPMLDNGSGEDHHGQKD